ncbi:recombining binding protein suppressor of hairless-like protein isoform X1 [Pimephales promelas]|uniref:recombining binding protein suppressor of hairless-like protein isoform X1 n=1 Tax=Pimephales promelas TaxID=90988 RepID=UPI001955D76E|nr:recombining binding protein suppressor of hairless-like protein isoform X1 [Pimephales promelas]
MQDQRKGDRETGLAIVDSTEASHLYTSDACFTHLREEQNFSMLQKVTRDSVRQYLQFRPDQSVIILHAKVAQKSYGNEKRFFCPPPCVYLTGHGWKLRQEQLKGQWLVRASSFLPLLIHSNFPIYIHSASGLGESSCQLFGYMGLDSSTDPRTDSFKLSFEEQTDKRMFACTKTLYISDTDKRKHFRLLLHLFHSGGQEIGMFNSRLIKVISKPSQKRQSMKNADLCISSGSKVSLFNRLRSQTVSTRYLAVEDGAFVASARQWTAFTVTLVEEMQAIHSDYSMCDSYICYGCVVRLVCTDSGVALPPMVIRKVNKQHACLDVDEPVSQLHKCAFQFRDSNHMYLCLSNEKIIQFEASPCPKESNKVLLNDGSCWTIIGTEVVEYTFSESLAGHPTTISPVPVINGLELNGGGHVAMLELHGENFSPHLKVWFGDMEAETMFRSSRSLLSVVPDVSILSGEWRWMRQPITVPLSLIRFDGLIYRSSYSFTYTPEHSAPSQAIVTAERSADSDSLIDTIHQEFTRMNFHLFMQS